MAEKIPGPHPQGSLFFKVVAFFSRMQVGYLIHQVEKPHVLLALFAVATGTLALGIITLAAHVARLPLLFPPLAPSAFILFHTPLSPAACPRNVLLSHAIGLATGILCLEAGVLLWPHSHLLDPSVLNLGRIFVIALATGLTGVLMILCRCAHPPAAATALIASLGYFKHFYQMAGLLAAVVLLVLEAIVFVRWLGGLPYPLWRTDQRLTGAYRPLVEGIGTRGGFWQEAAARIYKQRGGR